MLNKWVTIKDEQGNTVKPYPTFFYLDWKERNAHWLTEDSKPSKPTFIAKVKWKQFHEVTVIVCTHHVPDLTEYYKDQIRSNYSNVSYLKSHLQKCVRRSNTYKAIKTAYHLFELDQLEFLRRLSIIAVEDALPLNGYSVLVWFIAAVSNGYKMSKAQFAWCLGYVYNISECTCCDRTLAQSPSPTKLNFTKLRIYQFPVDQY